MRRLLKACSLTLAIVSMIGSASGQNAPAAKAVAPITLETFAAPPFMDEPELSPSGKWVATKLSGAGTQLLAMMNLYDKANKPILIRLDSAKFDVDWWNWVNDDWLLVGISSNTNVEGDKWRIRRVMSVERATGRVVPLGWKDAAQNAANVIWTARDGTPRILLGIQNSIYVNTPEFWPEVREFDVSTGKSKLATQRRVEVMDYYADGQGNVRLGYGYDDDKQTSRLLYRSTGSGSFTQIDKADGRKDEGLAFPAMFLPAADQALTVDNSDGFDAVYELDLKTLKRGKKVFGAPSADVGRLVRNTNGDVLMGAVVHENRPKVQWIDPGLAKTQADFDAAVGAGNAHIISWDREMNLLMVKVGGPDQAGAYYIYNRREGGAMSRLAYVNEQLKMQRLGPVKTITYKARDGMTIPAILTLPKDKAAKNLPLIVLPHGGPGARDYESWDWWVQFLAWRGYAVVQPNYRGSTELGKAFQEAGEGQWGLKMQDDLNDAITHLAKEGIADPKRVCIAGASYGGYAALRAAQRDGALYRCAISYAGVADIGAMARYDSRSITGNSAKAYWKESAPNSSDVSPVKHAADFNAPMLIMHGKLDLRVPVEQSRNMAAKLKGAGKPYRYVEQPLGDHHFSRTEDRRQFLQEMDTFLKTHNPPD
jgi:dipeptidyl aminopeptidase/acylaminoacyl peptidase